MSRAAIGDVEAETGGEQCPGHVRKCEEEKSSSPKIIDRSNCRPSEAAHGISQDHQTFRGSSGTYTKLIRPNPQETRSALLSLAFASRNKPMTNVPLIAAGTLSPARTGMVDALAPIPTPSSRRHMSNSTQLCVQAEPITERKQNQAAKKIVPRRPRR
ncbi:MAG: hypothetical protein L6R41_007743 [Letrouitia leprolyta]|nr:MAG: hypothetical protein L6R41_007743 [Letrouitia leprolyta]